MSISAAHSAAFIKEVNANGEVWAIRDKEGYPTSTNSSGEMAMPFWSLESRAKAVIEKVFAYRSFTTERLSRDAFVQRWLPGLAKDGLFVGLNWSGERAVGYDMHPNDVLARLLAKKA